MRFYFKWFLIFTGQILLAQSPLSTKDFEAQKRWVDSVYNSMTLKEKVGQLFMVQAFSEEKNLNKKKLKKLIRDNHIGGIIYSKGGPVRQAKLNNELQSYSKWPLLIGMDAEWGLSMRLDSTYAYPWNMTLGAVDDLKLIQKTGQYIGEHCKRLGVHFNFAPVVDINTNPNNPIIGNRSFGEQKNRVAQHALAFMQGLQGTGILATAKHFPGHGDSSQDSHKMLPTIGFSKNRINDVEFFPYKTLISSGLTGVMVAHLNVPSLEAEPNTPSSLSNTIVTKYLKGQLNFEGLIFTDALEMKGVSEYDSSQDIDLKAFLAGNDVLLMSANVELGAERLLMAYHNGRISEDRLANSVKKILMAKYSVGLHHYKPVELHNLTSDLNRLKDEVLNEKLFQNAQTLITNNTQLIPVNNLDKRRIAYVSLGGDSGSIFFESLNQYTAVTKIQSIKLDELIQKLRSFDTVIIGVHKSNETPWKPYKLTNSELVWIQEIARQKEVILSVFANPYSLNNLKSVSNIESLLMAYQNSPVSQRTAAHIIFGAYAAKGKLPVSIESLAIEAGHGLETQPLGRLSYGLPESVGMSSDKLSRVDSVANYAIDNKMTPGIQLLVARHGKVIYNKNFGYHTYQNQLPVRSNDIYDLASLTKILSTLPLVMELVDNGVITLEDQLGELLPAYKTSNKSEITLKEMLSHCAGLQPWIPFYKSTLDSLTQKPNSVFYSSKKSTGFPLQISDQIFLRKDFSDSIHNTIISSELLDNKEYRYSDLPYYILKEFLESHYGLPLNELIKQKFLGPIGANFTTYRPLEYFNKSQIPPTEEDQYFRFNTVHGHVHDMGAAMQNGVGGHAGLFSNTNDVAKLMQMYLQKGFYGGRQFMDSNTIDAFNTCYYCDKNNRRGVGFDKPQLEEEGPTCGCVSMTSFGHSGFTGTYAWADPEEQIIYVFLSNRTYPDSNNNRLLKDNIRTEIQRLIYEAITD